MCAGDANVDVLSGAGGCAQYLVITCGGGECKHICECMCVCVCVCVWLSYSVVHLRLA